MRFGQVHLYNTVHEGSRTAPVYAVQYSVGVGYKAEIRSEQNVFDVVGATRCPQVVKNPGSASKSGAISDIGSLVNGSPLNLSGGCSFAAASWTIPYAYQAEAASSVKARVLQQAGPGKLAVP